MSVDDRIRYRIAASDVDGGPVDEAGLD